ncbi:MAG: hypothetical protein EXS10_02255 [Phycisphaerales bacterium]|nr:hypothetical protein [Phycisphaerales bacterium]
MTTFAQCAMAVDPPVDANPANLLAGPTTVASVPAPPSLLHQDFDRAFEHIVGEAGIEAMLRLPLTEAQKAIVSEIAQERTVQFNAVAKRSYAKLVALQGIETRLQGPPHEKVRAAVDLLRGYLATRSVIHRESALDALEKTGAFDAAQLATARAMVEEYEKALRDEIAAATPNLEGDELDRRVHIALLLDILKDTLEMEAKTGAESFAQFSAAVELTPAQEERVKLIFTPIVVQELQGNRVAALDRVRALLEVSRELTAEQRERAWTYIHNQEREVEESRKTTEPEAPKLDAMPSSE